MACRRDSSTDSDVIHSPSAHARLLEVQLCMNFNTCSCACPKSSVIRPMCATYASGLLFTLLHILQTTAPPPPPPRPAAAVVPKAAPPTPMAVAEPQPLIPDRSYGASLWSTLMPHVLFGIPVRRDVRKREEKGKHISERRFYVLVSQVHVASGIEADLEHKHHSNSGCPSRCSASMQ